ncbi:multidrug efflux pump subunit AcrA (membrane-fusion protein) [Undibacterium sp. GrIS 1.8]
MSYQEQISQSQPLFRLEVTASHSQQWLGAIRLARPISAWLIAGVALIVTMILIAFITLGNVTKKARVTGITLPIGGSISISAPNAGLLVNSHVIEGQTVSAGQILFELSTERQGDKGEITALVAQQLATRRQTLEAEQRLRTAQAIEKKQALVQRLNNLTTEASQLEQEIVLTQRRHSLAQDSVTKFQTLQNNGYVSAAQTQQKQEDMIDVDTHLSTLRRNKLQLEANQLAMQAELNAQANSLATD